MSSVKALMKKLDDAGFWPKTHTLPAYSRMLPNCIGYVGTNGETVMYGHDYRRRLTGSLRAPAPSLDAWYAHQREMKKLR